MKILMVCLGNICRSPLAEGILKSKLDAEHFVDSAGTSGHHSGELPDRRSIEIARLNGLDITDQKSRKFTVNDFDNFDMIYAMDSSNYHNIIQLSRNEEDVDKVKMILNESSPGDNLNVPDPYYGGDQGFVNVYNMLDEACEVIASKIQ
ncbi:low molecular weight protein-tyrosine-phosphatase [uncultured Tenacibaculum sp.]|uniref:low molecular weight protein-tyrosine-phosphatase n=1 Tax=uncultured Tenacibaculum sp. TaxID=174713 RepID=UPI002634219F|nr:low molecular weight protein-tyrosine-phosphatase [uncultured Tenacibaculum sp.]